MSDVTLKHPYTSFKADGSDPTQVRASNWNEPHIYTGGTDGQVLARNSVSTTGASWIPKTTAGIDVSFYATGGTGASGSPWTGWDTAITWTAETEYHFKSGTYSYSTSPNFLLKGIALVGEAGTILKFTGTGNAVVFNNPAGQSPTYLNWTMNVRMENFIIQGNANATNGLFLGGVRNGLFKHISVRDVSNAGIWTEACVTNVLDNFRVTKFEMPSATFNTVPAYGIVIGTRTLDGSTSTTWSIINPVIEGTSTVGIWIKANCYGNTIINGTSEANTGKGMLIDAASTLNTIINTDFEQNAGTDIEINGSRNGLINCLSDDNLVIGICQETYVLGGTYHDVSVSSSANFIRLEGLNCTGTITDSSVDSIKFGNASSGFRYESFLGNYLPRMTAISFVDPLPTNAFRSSHFWTIATANFTLQNPTNPTNGQTILWRIAQDGTGSRIITFDTKFVARSDQAGLPVLHTAASTVDYIRATYDSNRDKWDVFI